MKIDSKNIGLAAVAVLALAAFLWWSGRNSPPEQAAPADSAAQQSQTPAPTPAVKTPVPAKATTPAVTADGIYLVYYNPSGFSPRTLEIPLGKSVRFVNNSGKAMRISSSDNTDSPVFAALNQSKTVGQGGVYEYTFIYKGSYSYNNINNPADQGVVIVK